VGTAAPGCPRSAVPLVLVVTGFWFVRFCQTKASRANARLDSRWRLSPPEAFSASSIGRRVLTGKPTAEAISRDGSAPAVQVPECAPDEIISATIFADRLEK
jgi:hypothetical protein